MKTVRIQILIFIILSLISNPVSADVVESNEWIPLKIGICVYLSSIGSIILTTINERNRIAETPSYNIGAAGVVVGVSTVALLYAAELQDNADVDTLNWYMCGLVSVLSVVSGSYAMNSARSNISSDITGTWSAAPFSRLRGSGTQYGVMIKIRL